MALAILPLIGCSSSNDEDLRQWMAEQRRQTVPRVSPISEPKQYVPLEYTEVVATDPFSSIRLTQALKRDSDSPNSSAALLAPELNRRKEPLESHPLDTMVMVGSLERKGQRVALVKVDSLLYQVRQGNYLGQNYGRVMKVAEGEITLREIVQDAAGEWIERSAALQLQEKTK
ncbi:pilus assembly protein PilP [Ottowia thiooxydans]|uniref:pilus assembly protein PilP n=1 Tax=Ottowia thiooxydans TaxID=219182 RepID=UPI0004918371|nr:pilus assembly protein PilP [Ottowia thiooxydans]